MSSISVLNYSEIKRRNPTADEAIEELDFTPIKITQIVDNSFLRFTNLKKLNLQGNNFSTVRENTFARLRELTNLNLSNCGITTFEDRPFFQLQQLKHLDLSNNDIRYVRSAESEYEISQNLLSALDNLLTLNLSNCNIVIVKPNTFEHMEKLIRLDLSNNKIIEIKRSISGLSLLPSIGSSKSAKSGQSTHILSTVSTNSSNPKGTFAGLVSLQILLLNNNAITIIQPQAFYGLTSLKKLDLSHNGLSSLTMEKTFGPENVVREFDISHNRLTTIHRSFINMTSLQKLNLSSNALDLETDSGNIFTGLTGVSELDLSNNRIVIIRYNLLHPLSGIQLLDLSHNQIQRFDIGSLINIGKDAQIILEGNDIIKISDINALTKDKLYDFLLSHQTQSINSGIIDDQPVSDKLSSVGSDLSSLTSRASSNGSQHFRPVRPTTSQSSSYRRRPGFGSETSFGGSNIFYDKYIKYQQKSNELTELINKKK